MSCVAPPQTVEREWRARTLPFIVGHWKELADNVVV